ncbi:cytidine deaminase, partial [Escherichia coli]|nr:cytidine deaminase [Escherichia coli]
GHGRQCMKELNSGGELQIRRPGRAPATLADYLPDAFGPKDLDVASLLMDEVDHGHQLALNDALAQAALAAANRSHAPYSNAHS